MWVHDKELERRKQILIRAIQEAIGQVSRQHANIRSFTAKASDGIKGARVAPKVAANGDAAAKMVYSAIGNLQAALVCAESIQTVVWVNGK